MVVDRRIAGAADGQIEPSMPRKERQHMVEKAAAGLNFTASGTVKANRKSDIRFRCFAGNVCCSHVCSSKMAMIASMSACICASVPTVMRL